MPEPSASPPQCEAGPGSAATGRRPRARLGGRWGCLAVLLVLAVCLVFWRRPVLQGMAMILVVDQEPRDVNCVLIDSGDGCYDEAAALWREDPSRRLLLMEPPPCRLVRLGALPTTEQTGRRALQARGVPRQAVEVIAWSAGDPPTKTERLQAWMGDRPHDRILLLCERFESRRARGFLDRRLGPGAAARVAVRGLPDRRYDETDWWTSRRGAKALALRGMALVQAWCCGEQEEDREDWDPDDYERGLRDKLAEVAP